jgi:allophanate hydrolase
MLYEQPFDIQSLRKAYAAGLSPAEVVKEVYRRIAALDDPGILISLRPLDEVLAEANALPAGTPLFGLPFAIKDNIDAAGMITTAACPAFAYEAANDAFVVDRLRRAGALMIGKTNLDQFATGLVGVRTPYPVPKNALDPAIVPGGSSSGSAVAVAQGLVSFAIGTDTAGSGRVPAALNGIVGLKPTLGAFSNGGVVPACRTLDTLSVFAFTPADAFEVFRQAAAYDQADCYSKDLPPQTMAAMPPHLRAGVPNEASRRFNGDAVQADSYRASLNVLAGLGVGIVEIDFTPFYEVAELLYNGPWVAERHAVIDGLLAKTPDDVHPVTRRITEVALKFSATDTFRAFYRLKELRQRIAPVLASVDFLCVPSIPTFFTVADLEADPIGPNSTLGTYTNFVNLLDLAAIAVPTAPRTDGRPGSVTLIAPAGGDARIAAVASTLHSRFAPPMGATGWPVPATPAVAPAAEPKEIAIAVVGAHMSGLPLNGELTRLGSRFIKAAKTAPNYRLYALDGGPPKRPGLVRSPDGCAIALEIWAIPQGQFGTFMAGIPAPLSIGTLTLDDGTSVHGFLCEAEATHTAEDVTAHGGWRTYLDTLNPNPQHDKEPHHATA